MSLDSFTAGLVLNAITTSASNNQDNDRIVDFIKQLPDEGGPSDKDIAFFEANKNKKCKIINTGYTGILYGLNHATGGFYNGGRFPFFVKILDSEKEKFKSSIGSVFEYGAEQVEIIE